MAQIPCFMHESTDRPTNRPSLPSGGWRLKLPSLSLAGRDVRHQFIPILPILLFHSCASFIGHFPFSARLGSLGAREESAGGRRPYLGCVFSMLRCVALCLLELRFLERVAAALTENSHLDVACLVDWLIVRGFLSYSRVRWGGIWNAYDWEGASELGAGNR